MPNLYPIFTTPNLFSRERDRSALPRYKQSYFFDFVQGDFVVDGSGKVIHAVDYETWWQWCVKTVLTERYAYPIYSRRYGTEIDQAIRSSSREQTEASLKRTITGALMCDRRTRSVGKWRFKWVADELHVDFEITPTVGTRDGRLIRMVING